MFDYLKCNYPLPNPEAQDFEFQTKDLESTMSHYLITEEANISAKERYIKLFIKNYRLKVEKLLLLEMIEEKFFNTKQGNEAKHQYNLLKPELLEIEEKIVNFYLQKCKLERNQWTLKIR